MIGSVASELDILKKLEAKRVPLVERYDFDWSRIRGDAFVIPKSEGEWDIITSNRASTIAWKVISVLGTGKRKLYIPNISGDDSKTRNNISLTEGVVNGLIWGADLVRQSNPDSLLIQMALSFYQVVRGTIAYRAMVMSEDEKTYLDLDIWDARNLTYIASRDKLLKVYYTSYCDEWSIKYQFPGWNGKVGTDGTVKMIDVWDCSEAGKSAKEAVIINDEFVKEPEDVIVGDTPIDYLPIYIKSGGVFPIISDDNEDNIAHSGESVLVNFRNLIDTESRLLSYALTAEGLEIKAPIVVHYNSQASGGKVPDLFDKDPRVKNRVIWVDDVKKETIDQNGLPSPRVEKTALMLSKVGDMADVGGLSRITSGIGSGNDTASGIAILDENSKEFIKPFKDGVENGIANLGHMVSKQYKAGSFKKDEEFKFYNSKYQLVSIKGKPQDMIDDREIICEIQSEALRERATKVGMASAEMKAGLISPKGAMDKYQLQDAPDEELDNIEQYKVEEMLGINKVKGVLRLLKDYKKDKSFEAKTILKYGYKALAAMQEAQVTKIKGGQSIEGIPGGTNPEQLVAQQQLQPPQPLQPPTQ